MSSVYYYILYCFISNDMIVFIKLVKRVSILHEKFFIYKDQLTNTNHTIPTIQYNTILSEYKHTNSPNIQTHQLNNTKQTTSEY